MRKEIEGKEENEKGGEKRGGEEGEVRREGLLVTTEHPRKKKSHLDMPSHPFTRNWRISTMNFNPAPDDIMNGMMPSR